MSLLSEFPAAKINFLYLKIQKHTVHIYIALFITVGKAIEGKDILEM